jgi:hypothetical protein
MLEYGQWPEPRFYCAWSGSLAGSDPEEREQAGLVDTSRGTFVVL